MKEVVLRLDVPKGLEPKVELAIERVLNMFLREIKFEIAREILEESELSEEQARELAKEVNLSVAKRHLELVKIAKDSGYRLVTPEYI